MPGRLCGRARLGAEARYPGEDRGDHQFKGIDEARRVYRVAGV